MTSGQSSFSSYASTIWNRLPNFINPRTYKQSHTPTIVQDGGGGVDGTLPWVFVMLQYFEKNLPLVESLRCALQDEVHIMGCRAAGGL